MAKIVKLHADIKERDLQRNVRAFGRQMGWKDHVAWTSIHSPRGWPDVTFARERDGVAELVIIELKAENGKTTPEQDWWLSTLAKVPGVKWCGVIRPSDWFAGALDEVLR